MLYIFFDVTSPKYWNDNWSAKSYYFPNESTTTYTSPTQIPDVSSIPIYIKTTATEHQAFAYYNNKELCVSANFWDTNASTTRTKLKNKMASALGVSTSSVSCNTSRSYAQCSMSSIIFEIRDGSSESRYGDHVYCDVLADGRAVCY